MQLTPGLMHMKVAENTAIDCVGSLVLYSCSGTKTTNSQHYQFYDPVYAPNQRQ
jgi:hypothetical protein